MFLKAVVIYLTVLLIIFTFAFGCNRPDTPLDMAVDVHNEEVLSDNIDHDVPFCKVDDILSVGQKCMDKGTDAVFEVLENGLGSYTSESGLLNEATDVLDATGQTLNDMTYNFIARRQEGSGNWKVEMVSSQ